MASMDEIRTKVMEEVSTSSHRQGLATVYLAEMERAVQGLQSLGFNLGLEFQAPPPALQFPKMLYHPSGAPAKVVHSGDEEAEARAAGWQEHPSFHQPQLVMPGVSPPAPPPPPRTTVRLGRK